MGRFREELDPSLEVKMPIGPLLRKISKEKQVSVKTLAALFGCKRANVYRDFTLTNMEDTKILEWAEFLGVEPQEIYERWVGTEGYIAPGFQYTRKILTEKLEEKTLALSELERELELRDVQIALLKELLVADPEKGRMLVQTPQYRESLRGVVAA